MKDYLVFVPLVNDLTPPDFESLPYYKYEHGIHFFVDCEEHFLLHYSGVACARLYAHDSDNDPSFPTLFSRYGTKCFERLVGDFSYVFLHEGSLVLAKDQLGVRPLFYYQDEEKFIASTSISYLKLLIKPALNFAYIASELKSIHPNTEETFFENIHRFPPAHYGLFELQSKKLVIKRYWELKAENTEAFPSSEEKLHELRRRLKEAIVCRAGEVTGCQLSGGLDSSAIAVLLARSIGTERLHTYSFVLNDKTRPYSYQGVDEQNTQNSVINYASLRRENHHPIDEFHFQSVEEELARSEEVMGSYASSNCIWQDSMFKIAASHGVRVMMSGFPGDEGISISGTRYFYDALSKGKFFSFWKQQPLRNSKRILKYFYCKWKKTTQPGIGPMLKKRNLLNTNFPQPQDKLFYAFYPTFKQELKEKITRSNTTLRMESEGSFARTHGIETVYPLADIRLLSWIYSLPSEMFAPVPYTRALFRNVCKGILPEDVRIQPKFNGATTLAFAHAWMAEKDRAFEKIPLLDPYGMVNFKRWEEMKNQKEYARIRLNALEILYSIERHRLSIKDNT